MHATLRSTLALALLLAPLAATASPPEARIEQGLDAQRLHETGLDLLSPAQLDALNRLLRERDAGAARDARADAPVAQSRPRIGEDHGWLIGLQEGPVKTRLKGSVAGWQPGTVFELENGQRWQVLKGGMKLPRTMDAPEVVLVPGIAGRWFLQFDEDQPKARVFLLD